MNTQMTYAAFESRYRERQYIGSGGFAKVYKVFDHAKNHYVALKVADVRPEWKQFTLQREVELVNGLDHHRNIARYDACYRFNYGITGDTDFAVLKFYEYGNLEQFLAKEDLVLEEKQRVIKGILRGVGFLHRNNITHRDVKAQNILMNREDGVWTPKITDFGLARQFGGSHTMTNSSIGLTYAYAAPEQILNNRIQKNVDLWATGVIIYRIIMGDLPFKGHVGGDKQSTQSQLEISRKILNLELPPDLNTAPEPFQTMIRRCLVLDPTERAQTAEELLDILEANELSDIGESPAIKPVNPGGPAEEIRNLPRKEEKKPEAVGDETELLPPPGTPPVPAAYQTNEETPAPAAPPYPAPPPSPAPAAAPPPLYEEPEELVYDQPHANHTHVMVDAPLPPPEIVAGKEDTPRLQTGHSRSPSAAWGWLVAIPVLAALIWAGINFWPEPSDVSLGGADVQVIEPAYAASNLSAELQANKIDAAALRDLLPKIEAAAEQSPQDHEILYLAAKNLFYLGRTDDGLEQLAKAAGQAKENGRQDNFRQRLESEANTDNGLRRAIKSPRWSAILQEL